MRVEPSSCLFFTSATGNQKSRTSVPLVGSNRKRSPSRQARPFATLIGPYGPSTVLPLAGVFTGESAGYHTCGGSRHRQHVFRSTDSVTSRRHCAVIAWPRLSARQ